MLDAKVTENSRNHLSFLIVLSPEKDGAKMFGHDYRSLSEITLTNAYPLPVRDDILATLGSTKYFYKLDLKSGYWQVEIYERDKAKTAF